MSPIRYLPLPFLGWLGLAVAAAYAADPTLGEAVRKTDKKYLDSPEIGVADESPKIIAGGGEEGLPPLDEEISQGPLRVTLTYVEEEPEDGKQASPNDLPGGAEEMPVAEGEVPGEGEAATGDVPADEIPLEDIPEEAMLPDETGLGEPVWHAPVVTVYFDDPKAEAPAELEAPAPSSDETDDGTAEVTEEQIPEQGAGESGDALGETADAPPTGPHVVARLQGDSAGFSNPPVSVQIAELDPDNPYPEVVVSFFTGGAHCCSVTRVVTSDADGSEWAVVDVGEFDGGPMIAVDLDGNGTYEFETRDNVFLYAFACYACSEAPLQVLALEDGEIKDVSADPRFQPAHAAWLKNMIVGVPEQEVNGFLAGYVGEKIRLGEGKEAWKLMLKYYDRNSDWGLEICQPGLDASGECPEETTMVTFPEALERMLNKNGYKIGS